jgi:hypothetical protein
MSDSKRKSGHEREYVSESVDDYEMSGQARQLVNEQECEWASGSGRARDSLGEWLADEQIGELQQVRKQESGWESERASIVRVGDRMKDREQVSAWYNQNPNHIFEIKWEN